MPVRWRGCGDRRNHAAHRRGRHSLRRLVVRAADRWICRRRSLATIRDYTFRLARALNVIGLMNVQYAMQREKVFVIEVNPRASRTVPYVSARLREFRWRRLRRG